MTGWDMDSVSCQPAYISWVHHHCSLWHTLPMAVVLKFLGHTPFSSAEAKEILSQKFILESHRRIPNCRLRYTSHFNLILTSHQFCSPHFSSKCERSLWRWLCCLLDLRFLNLLAANLLPWRRILISFPVLLGGYTQ